MHPLPIQELLDEHDRVHGFLEEARRLLSGLLARTAVSLEAEAREFSAGEFEAMVPAMAAIEARAYK